MLAPSPKPVVFAEPAQGSALLSGTTEDSERQVGWRAFAQDHSEPKVLLEEGFASEKERLGVQATLTHCRPLEAHLSRGVA